MITVERVTVDEFKAVLPLLQRFFEEEGFDIPEVQVRGQLDEMIHGSSSAVFLARVGDRPVGVATVTTSGGIEFGLSAELEDLYVLPEARGTGVGSALIETAKDWCISRGCSLIAVMVTPEGQAAHGLVEYYLGRGFRESGRTLLFARLQPGNAIPTGDWEETETE
ncbi:MAG: GNAT family N-acetyltransferase [Anaerolineae bacterium]|nr:GNAT family N-acetyltransferase [Anaerolineae bacterium]